MFIEGLLAAVVFFIALMLVFYAGYKLGSNVRPNNKKPPDSDELERAKKDRKDFMDMMNYDVETALQRKKV